MCPSLSGRTALHWAGGPVTSDELDVRSRGPVADRSVGLPLLPPHGDPRLPRHAGRAVAPARLRARPVPVVHGGRVADPRAGRAAVLLHAYEPAHPARRPRAAVLRRRPDRTDPAAGARDPVGDATPLPDASARRAADLGREPAALAPARRLRGRAAPLRAARDPAPALLHVRLPDVGAGGRGAA